jgi:hypothetical protein
VRGLQGKLDTAMLPKDELRKLFALRTTASDTHDSLACKRCPPKLPPGFVAGEEPPSDQAGAAHACLSHSRAHACFSFPLSLFPSFHACPLLPSLLPARTFLSFILSISFWHLLSLHARLTKPVVCSGLHPQTICADAACRLQGAARGRGAAR